MLLHARKIWDFNFDPGSHDGGLVHIFMGFKLAVKWWTGSYLRRHTVVVFLMSATKVPSQLQYSTARGSGVGI